ncbi:MAG: NAD-dependent epimerase/dehydratase family protein [Burkholderiaceae bacterium]
MPSSRAVLITGAQGAIGQTLRQGLKPYCRLMRLTDIRDLGPAAAGEECHQADLADLEHITRLAEGMDAIVHLGGALGAIRQNGKVVGETSWDTILHANIVGTYNVLEAARRNGIKRVVYASSIHAHGFYRRERRLTLNDPPRPDTRYGLSKAFGEAAGRYYADKFGLQVVALRIATFKQRPSLVRDLGTWISPGDMTELVRCSLDYPDTHFDVLWGVSANTRSLYDNPNAQRYGYFPKDNSEDYRDQLIAQPEAADDNEFERLFHAAHLASTEWAGDVAKIL